VSSPFAPPLRLLGARDAPITSLGDWLALAPPAGRASQWRAGRSARELASAWLRLGRPALPEELAALLVSRPETTLFACGQARPEATIALDEHKGATRNADLLLLGEAAGGRTLVTVEAKADEEFGQYVSDALKAVEGKDASNLPKRIAALSTLLFGEGADPSHLRYQLIHGLAATVLEAQRLEAAQAVFAIHEFRTELTNDKKRERNHQDLRYFMADFGAEYIQAGRLERVAIRGAPDLPVFVGYVTTDTTQGTA
jgi:uncharacterized protein DUF6946